MAMNDPILNLLRRRIGLDPDSLGERVIEDCLADLGRKYPELGRGALALLAERDASVFADVVGHFVVNESWLFRTPEQFAALQKFAQTRPRPLNVLSLPAANGEEPASIAISLHEAGLQPGEFRIIAGDIDLDALQRARSGRFPRSAFRGSTPDPRWFAPHGDDFLLSPALLARIEFRELNVLDADVLRDESFDVIFCRNLLIYLHDAARARLLALLRRVAAPGALICTGTAEPQLHALPNAAIDTPSVTRPRTRAMVAPRPTAAATPAPLQRDVIAPVHVEPVSARLDRIEQRANEGDLAGARAELDLLLEQIAPNAAAWYLRGVFASAQQDLPAAEAALDRAAYIDPTHQPTLRLRAELARRGGRHDHADRLQAQLRRRRGNGRES